MERADLRSGGIIMKQFFFAVALTLALAAGAVAVLTVQLTHAAAQTITFPIGPHR